MVRSGPLPGQVDIRDVQDADLELFLEHQLDPEATRMAAFPSRDRDAFMAHWAKSRADETVVAQTVVVDEEVVGHVVSWVQSGKHEVGYWIDRRFWGRGIATKALTLFLERMRVRPLHAYVAVHNTGSIRVLEKDGFRRVTPDAPNPTAANDGVEEVVLVLET